jgi:multiple sugar transport system substrate-binding protein
LAWNNKLVAVNDILEPLKDLYDPIALEGVNYQNKVTGKRNYYAVPIMQSAIHIHYWQAMLTEIGISRKNIPRDWKGFWQFWEQAQDRLRQAGFSDVYSVGMPISFCLDTYNNFEQFLEAYDVQILDREGRLQVDQPDVRQGIAKALTQYTQFQKNGKVPPEAVDWDNTGNNKSLLNRKSLMTVNHTLSVPGSQRQAENIYYNRLATVPWPNKPNGRPMRYVLEVKQVVLFKSSKKQEIAKNFLSYLAQPGKLQKYAEGSQARYLPVMPMLFKEPFWQDAADVHIAVALQQLKNTRPAYQVFNPAYGEVAAQNVWGNVIRRISAENLSTEQATDQAIEEIQKIFANWK